MAYGNVRREAYTAGSEATLLSLEIFNDGAFVVVEAGGSTGNAAKARRDGPSGVTGMLQSCRWTAREPGRPGSVRVRVRLEWEGQRYQSRPRSGIGACTMPGALGAGTNPSRLARYRTAKQ